MIDLHFWPTPNGHKISIFLEEAGLDYRFCPVNIGKGEQFRPEFLKIAPNNRMPAIVDHAPADGGEPISVFESGAILVYLAGKTGKFLSPDLRSRIKTLEWLFWQMGGLGPMAGQNHHFSQYAPQKIPYAIDRYVKETNRLYGVLDRQLALAHPAHAREMSPAAFWGQEALELLQFLAAAHEPLGAGGALWEVVGCLSWKGGLWFGGLEDRLGDG